MGIRKQSGCGARNLSGFQLEVVPVDGLTGALHRHDLSIRSRDSPSEPTGGGSKFVPDLGTSLTDSLELQPLVGSPRSS